MYLYFYLLFAIIIYWKIHIVILNEIYRVETSRTPKDYYQHFRRNICLRMQEQA